VARLGWVSISADWLAASCSGVGWPIADDWGGGRNYVPYMHTCIHKLLSR
jgi:hypothetical protein